LIYIKYSKFLSGFIPYLQLINLRIPSHIFDNGSIRTGFISLLLCFISFKEFVLYLKELENSNKIYLLLQLYLFGLTLLNAKDFRDIIYAFGVFLAYFMYIAFQFLNNNYKSLKNLDRIIYIILINAAYWIISSTFKIDLLASIYQNERITANYGVYLIGEYSPLAVCITYFTGFLLSLYQFNKIKRVRYIIFSLIFLIISILTHEKIVFGFLLISILSMGYERIINIKNYILRFKFLYLFIIPILYYGVIHLSINIDNIRIFNNPTSYLINNDRISLWTTILDGIYNKNLYNPMFGNISYIENFGYIINDYHNYFLRLYLQGGFIALIIFFYWLYELNKLEKYSNYRYIFNTFLSCVLLACLVQDAFKSINVIFLLALHKSILDNEK
jgi:hypothetical protein